MSLSISTEHISYDELCHSEKVVISDDSLFRQRLDNSHQFLLEEIAKGKPIYGVTTGYGESGKNYSAFEEAKELQKNLFRFHGCGVGDFLSHEECKRILLIRLSSLSKGFSGITVGLLERMALAIMNGTAAMSGIAIEAMSRFENWLHAYESFIAGLFEMMHADGTPLQPLVHEVKPFKGQIRTAAQLAEKLLGSEIVHAQDERYDKFFEHEELCIQDKYSIRCTPQVLGVVWDNLEISKKWVETECNAVNDNPIIDGEGKKIYTSGNFYGGYVAHAMDTLKIAAANAADLLDKQFSLLVDHKFNRGIGENLKLSDKAHHHGFKAMQITLSSLSADVMICRSL